MTALQLTRTDPDQNMARFYRLDVQPDLFGGWSLWREWGRMGCSGTVRRDPYPTQDAAEVAKARLAEAKARRGYRRGYMTLFRNKKPSILAGCKASLGSHRPI